MNIKKIIAYILTVLISIGLLLFGYNYTRLDSDETTDTDEYAKAVVISIEESEPQTESTDTTQGSIVPTVNNIIFKAEITSEPYKGEIVEAKQVIDEYLYAGEIEVVPGDQVLLTLTQNLADDNGWYFAGFNRFDTIFWLIGGFLLLILLVGRLKGISTILSLCLTCVAIFAVYIPGILNGINIYLITSILCIYIIVMSIIILNGYSKKTLCAILGNICGVAISAGLALLMNYVLKITGLIDQDYMFLTFLNPDNPLDLKALVWGGIVVGSLGAIMDVAVSLASSVNELAEHMENSTFSKLFKSGMNIGKDAIGTMTNTLILAYIGSSLAIVLLFMAYNRNILFLLNMEMIIVEISQAIVGSIGILAAVPMTVGISAYIFSKFDDEKSVDRKFDDESFYKFDEENSN